MIDVAALQSSQFTVTPKSIEVALPGIERMELNQTLRGWVRRVAPADWDQQVTLGSSEAAVKASWLALLSAILRVADVEWLGDPTSVALADNKLLQYAMAERASIPTPRTVVTSDPKVARDILGESFILKPLGPSQILDEGRARAVFANEVRSADPALAAMRGAPFVAQERIPADRHLRVVTVAEQAWVAALEADGELPLDWRRAGDAHRAFATIDHPSLADRARILARALDVGYSSQDWIEDKDGNCYFLDLNPGEQWLFLPFGDQVTMALAQWLTARS